MKRFARSALSLLLAALLLVPSALAAGETDDVFRSQLSPLAQTIYDAMDTRGFLQALRAGESFTITFNGPFDDANATAHAIAAAEPSAFAALELKHWELFWVNGCSANISGNSRQLTIRLTPKFAYDWTGGGRSVAADESVVNSAVQRLAAEASAQGGAYEQLLYVHDWLTAHNEYNHDAVAAGSGRNSLPWTPLSALTDLDRPVCQGYAAAFKLVCDELGIPCLLVTGKGYFNTGTDRHAWNQVLLDGTWYAVDATNDDAAPGGGYGNRSGYESHDYFLIGSGTRVNGKAFSESHVADGEKIDGVTFRYPQLSAEAYDRSAAPQPAVPQPTEPQPTEPGGDEPDTPDRQSIPGTGTAYASTQPVTIDGRVVQLPAYALRDAQGNPTNYVRLRDLAALLNGTDAQFDVYWNAEMGIGIAPNQPYDHPNGSEGNIPFSGDQPYAAYLRDTFVNDASVSLTAFQISWNGADHTCYQLRDLGRALNFNVGWSAERGIFIEPGLPYSDAD